MKLRWKILIAFFGVLLLIIGAIFLFVVPRLEAGTLAAIQEEYRTDLVHIDEFFSETVETVGEDINYLLSDDDFRTTDDVAFTNYTKATKNGIVNYHPSPVEVRITYKMITFADSRSEIRFIYMGRENGSYLMNELMMDVNTRDGYLFDYDPRERPWYQAALANPGRIVVTDIYKPVMPQTRTTSPISDVAYISVVKTVEDNEGSILGVLGIDINVSALIAYLHDDRKIDSQFGILQGDSVIFADQGTGIHFVDAENNAELIAAVKQTELGVLTPFTAGGENKLIIRNKSKTNGWNMFYVLSKSDISKIVYDDARPIALLIMAILASILLEVLVLISLSVIAPIQKLSRTAAEITKTGNLDLQIKTAGKDEIGVLSRAFNEMVTQLKHNRDHLEEMVDERTKELVKFSKGIEQSPAVVVITDIEGTIEYVNPKFTELTGYTREEAIGQNPRVLKSGLTDPAVFTDMWKTVLSGKEWNGEFCNKTKTGELFWERVSMSPIKDDDGELINILAVKENITQQRMMNEELKKSEEKFRIIADYTYDWETWFSAEGKLLWTNPAVERMTGYGVQECYDNTEFPFCLFTQEEMPKVRELFRQAMAGSTGNDEVFHLRRKDGRLLWVALSWNPVFDKDGNNLGFRASARNITDRKTAEDESRRTKENLDLALSEANMGAWKFDAVGGTLIADENTKRLYGLEHTELDGTLAQWFTYLDPDDAAAVAQKMRNTMENQIENYRAEFRVKHPSGETHYIQSVGKFIYEGGKALEASGVVWDVTDIKKTQNELLETNKNLENTLEALTYPFYVIDVATHKVILANSAAKRISIDPEITTCHRLTHRCDTPCSTDEDPCPLEEVLQSKEPYMVEHTHYDENGNEVIVEVHGYPIFDEQGNVVRMIEYSMDITERKESERKTKTALEKVEKLYDASLALRSTMDINEVFKTILKRLKDVVPYRMATIEEVSDADFTIIYCEGYANPGELIGTKFPIKDGTLNAQLVRDKKPLIIPDVRKHDEFIDMTEGKVLRSFMGVPLVIHDKVIGVLTLDSTTLDFFDKDMAETANAFASQAAIALTNANNFKELMIAKETAEAATKAKGDFLANMSHEIRTPMNAVIGLNSLLEKTQLTAKQKDYVKKIGASASNLLNIINDILDFSKIESGKLNIETIDFNLEDVLDNLSGMVALKAQNKNLEFVVIKSPDVPDSLVGDPLRLGQVLLNLVNNAIKFTDEGEVVVKITKQKETKGATVLEFAVEDSGIGMTEEQLSKLFKAFTQADVSTTRKYGGTGLGLSISKNLVAMMGGAIRAESTYGEGSRFIFTCTFTKSDKKVSKRKIIPEYIRELNILVAEDNEYAREVLSNYLKDFQYEPTLVASGEEAISEAENKTFDVVLMDYRMPGINGIEAWRQIKSIVPEAQRPVCVLITAYAKEDIINDAMDEGIREVLSKPVSQSMLFDTIMRLFSDEEYTPEDTEETDKYPEGFAGIRGAQVLLVEDNEINQQVARETLELEGFWVDVAENGKIAIDKILAKDYDIVLMDLQMPVLDGYKATAKLRSEHKITALPVIALSADAMSGTKQDTMDAGMNDYITKPIDRMELFSTMVKWIKPKARTLFVPDAADEAAVDRDTLERYLKNIDVGSGLMHASDKIDLYISILGKFQHGNQDFAGELTRLLDAGDTEAAVRLAHTLKGVSGSIGAKMLNYHVKNLEADLKAEAPRAELDAKIALVSGELAILLPQVSALLEATDTGSPAAADATIPRAELLEKLRQLRQLIEDYDTAAKPLYESLAPAMQAGSAAKAYIQMGAHVENFDYEDALELCDTILAELEQE